MKIKMIIFLHMIVVILACSSFIWLDWRLIVGGIILYWLEILVFGGCILTNVQYGDKEHSFVGNGINKLLKPLKKS